MPACSGSSPSFTGDFTQPSQTETCRSFLHKVEIILDEDRAGHVCVTAADLYTVFWTVITIIRRFAGPGRSPRSDRSLLTVKCEAAGLLKIQTFGLTLTTLTTLTETKDLLLY